MGRIGKDGPEGFGRNESHGCRKYPVVFLVLTVNDHLYEGDYSVYTQTS